MGKWVVVVGTSGEGEPRCEVVEGISGAWDIWAAAELPRSLLELQCPTLGASSLCLGLLPRLVVLSVMAVEGRYFRVAWAVDRLGLYMVSVGAACMVYQVP